MNGSIYIFTFIKKGRLMKKMTMKWQKILKCFHLFFASLWIGGGISLTIMNFLLKASDGMELFGMNMSMKMIDDLIIIPGAVGSLLTGILYSAFTNWGWFKHRWITIKWIINIFGVLFGTFFLGPWLNSLPLISIEKGINALADPLYSTNLEMLRLFGTFQVSTIVLALVLSVLKPFRDKKQV